MPKIRNSTATEDGRRLYLENVMSERPLQLLIVNKTDDSILAQKFFTRKRKVERIRFEFTEGSVIALTAGYVPRENSLVLFIEQDLKG